MKRLISLFSLVWLTASCSHHTKHSEELAHIHIIDRNGITETISSKERLKRYGQVDFITPQPYQKVLRVFGRGKDGNVRSVATTYFPNGQIQKSLDIVNSRAQGRYQEWHANGSKKLACNVIGGVADLNENAAQTWIFDGECLAYNENGRLSARIMYSKGELEGTSEYYHPNGKPKKNAPYKKNQIDGTVTKFYPNGNTMETVHYRQGQKHGNAERFWESGEVAAVEQWQNGKLAKGRYTDEQKNSIAEVNYGNGFRAHFNQGRLDQLQEYTNGELLGLIQEFDANGILTHEFHVEKGNKHGEERYFREVARAGEEPDVKYSLEWYEGDVQGLVKTWYDSGQLESQKEMSGNTKHGVSTAWYSDGKLMFIEEYEHGRLMRGDYYNKTDGTISSKVQQGKGIATLFNESGSFVRKVNYDNGNPIQ